VSSYSWTHKYRPRRNLRSANYGNRNNNYWVKNLRQTIHACFSSDNFLTDNGFLGGERLTVTGSMRSEEQSEIRWSLEISKKIRSRIKAVTQSHWQHFTRNALTSRPLPINCHIEYLIVLTQRRQSGLKSGGKKFLIFPGKFEIKQSIFLANISEWSFFVFFKKCHLQLHYEQIFIFIFTNNHFRTYFLYNINCNNISRPVHDPLLASLAIPLHDPQPNILEVATPQPQDWRLCTNYYLEYLIVAY